MNKNNKKKIFILNIKNKKKLIDGWKLERKNDPPKWNKQDYNLPNM